MYRENSGGLGCHFDIYDSIELCIVELTRVACTCMEVFHNMMIKHASERCRKGSRSLFHLSIKGLESLRY